MNLSVAEEKLQALGVADKWEALKTQLQGNEYLKGIVTSFVITVNNGLADVVK